MTGKKKFTRFVDVDKAFGALAREARESRELTLQEVADHVGIGMFTYRRLELGESPLQLGAAILISSALELDLAGFIEEHAGEVIRPPEAITHMGREYRLEN